MSALILDSESSWSIGAFELVTLDCYLLVTFDLFLFDCLLFLALARSEWFRLA